MSGIGGPMLAVASAADLKTARLPLIGPVGIAVRDVGVLLVLSYGDRDATRMREILRSSAVVGGVPRRVEAPLSKRASGAVAGVSVPGDYRGRGFDTCAAPGGDAMDAWRATSGYGSIGIYIGGVNMGCAQPNLSRAWVARQVDLGWHLLPVYVGLQAPCSSFTQRMSYVLSTARAQGEADAYDAMARADLRGIEAPSTLYSDMEGYDRLSPAPVSPPS